MDHTEPVLGAMRAGGEAGVLIPVTVEVLDLPILAGDEDELRQCLHELAEIVVAPHGPVPPARPGCAAESSGGVITHRRLPRSPAPIAMPLGTGKAHATPAPGVRHRCVSRQSSDGASSVPSSSAPYGGKFPAPEG